MLDTIDTPTPTAHAKHGDHAGGLLLVGLFKLSKAVFFTCVGLGALKLIHYDLTDVVMRCVAWAHIDSEGRLAAFLMDKADLIGHHQLRQGALFALLYAALCVVEGLGLMARKVWAEYFTVVLTSAALPWEIYELATKYEPYKILLLAVNLVVLLYLLLVLKHKREQDADDAAEQAA